MEEIERIWSHKMEQCFCLELDKASHSCSCHLGKQAARVNVNEKQRKQMDRASEGALRSAPMARTNCDHLQKVETSWRTAVVVAGSVGIKLRELMEKR